MSQVQSDNKVPGNFEESFALIDQEEKADNWFKSILLFAIVLLIIFGSFVLLS